MPVRHIQVLALVGLTLLATGRPATTRLSLAAGTPSTGTGAGVGGIEPEQGPNRAQVKPAAESAP